MFNKITNLLARSSLLGTLAAMALITGCASNPSGPLDTQQLGSAVAIDDVSYVRSLVNARTITVDQVASGIGYVAAPMITVAARNASLSVLRYLIAEKANLNARTPDRDTAMMLAALFNEEDRERMSVSTMRYDQAVRLLVEAGANIENEDINAYTPLAYAAYAGRDSTVTYLLGKGAKANASAQGRVSYVNTPLMMAAMQGHRSVALHLLRAGADASVRVQNGMTALEYAHKYKQTQLSGILRCAESLKPGETFRQRCE